MTDILFRPAPQPTVGYGNVARSELTKLRTLRSTYACVAVIVLSMVGIAWLTGYRWQQILTDGTNGYGAKNVKDVKCNNGQNPTVKKGASFDCDVSIDGTKRQVTVTFQDSKGTYEVGRPK